MSNNLALHVTFTSQQIERLRKQYPDLADDAQLLEDTLAGETEFEPVLERVIHEAMVADAMAAGIDVLAANLKERKERLTRKSVAFRKMARALMEAAGRGSVSLPSYTLSVRDGTNTVSITDIDALPQGFFAIETKRVPRKDALKIALEAGADVPGAALVTGENILTVRTK